VRQQAITEAVLYLPPFAEEMNKARRMAMLQAHRFAGQGQGVLIPDLFGTGDSEGDFGDARWDIWLADLRLAVEWLQQQGVERLTLWGLRSGALLAIELLQMLCATGIAVELARIIFWQPVVRGQQMMTQFLRLRTAAEMMSGGEQLTTTRLREMLTAGERVEVAGYELSPALVQSIDTLELPQQLPGNVPSLDWYELVAATERPVAALSRRRIEQWQQGGARVHLEKLQGEPFWTTPEISVVPALLDYTLKAN
jgi:exosortase A-associated hydrolase 2